MNVALVILNWNGKDLLKEFLPSVIEYSEDRVNIYVADNASDDGSVSFIKQNFPNINIIQNIQNGGYAKGYNDSLKYLDEDLFILMNNDVEVTPNWLDPIIQEFEDDSTLFAAQPKILLNMPGLEEVSLIDWDIRTAGVGYLIPLKRITDSTMISPQYFGQQEPA